MKRVAYDRRLDPPAPVVPVRVEAPGSSLGALLPGLVDSGADCTLVPAALVGQLGLPQVDRVAFTGVGGRVVRSTVHAARVEIGGSAVLARVTAFGGELILGRDLLNLCSVLLDGPRLEVSLSWPRRRSR